MSISRWESTVNTDDRVEVARLGSGVGFRIVGPGSVRQGIAVHRASSACVCEGVQAVLLDLSSCTSVDSTFLGCLLRMYKQGKNRLKIVAPSAAVKGSMK